MKINFLSLVFFALWFNGATSQEGFIINKDGEKIIVDNSTVELYASLEKFKYQEPGSDKTHTINLDKITSAAIGKYRIETFNLDKEPRPCFILAELPDKKLVSYIGIYKTYRKYFSYIIDANNTVIETLKFSSTDKRDDTEAILKQHFSHCPELKTRMNSYESDYMNLENTSKRAAKFVEKYEEGNGKMILLFRSPTYSKCNSEPLETVTKADDLTKTATNTDNSAQYNGTYKFESMTTEFQGSKRTLPIKGTYIINDGFVEVKTKDNSPKYKIKSIHNGTIYLEDNNMTHTILVIPETGKKYDTKIVFTSDKKLGGGGGEYWCIKL
ncbi:hypothetical protein [Flavobacterium sp.]|uniref:hypothetical protein n=1 Tax=Flavobacterium sp. TaxID=239 RepID=UPI00263041A0|nr:hypothetical protein [Flavobacterium sp.]